DGCRRSSATVLHKRWRGLDLMQGDADDSIDAGHDESMKSLIIFSDNDIPRAATLAFRKSQRSMQAHNRHCLPADIRNSLNAGIRLRHAGERRALHHLPDLEDIDPVDFRLPQVE